jgi:hypothetical protein
MGFKANNLVVGNKKVASPKGGATPTSKKKKTKKSTPLELTDVETRILLEALKNSSFRGEMVEAIYILAVKLKNNLTDV